MEKSCSLLSPKTGHQPQVLIDTGNTPNTTCKSLPDQRAAAYISEANKIGSLARTTGENLAKYSTPQRETIWHPDDDFRETLMDLIEADMQGEPAPKRIGKILANEEITKLWEQHTQAFIRTNHNILRGLRPKDKECIVNLSTHKLSANEHKLLSRGLSFALSRTKYYEQNEILDKQGNEKRIAIRHAFPESKTKPKVGFYIKSNKPMRAHAMLQPYVRALNEVASQKQNNWSSNITPAETEALLSLKDNPTLVIKPADKGASIVLLNSEAYEKACYTQLADQKYYRLLQQPCAPRNAIAIKTVLDQMLRNREIDRRLYHSLLPSGEPRPRIFYGLPKIHKDRKKWSADGCPPLRPIVSDTGSESYNVAKLIAHHLKTPATSHAAYLRDTWHFLARLKKLQLPRDTLLITMDVEALYTNIPLPEGLKLCERALNKRTPEEKRVRTESLLRLLEIQVYNNDLVFNGTTFLQVHGTAMGKAWAPAFADIFMANWEETLFQHCRNMNIPYPNTFWVRYLDDIFTIWTHPREELDTFLETANNWHPHVTLDATVNAQQVDFLDVTVYKAHDHALTGRLDTKSYRKPTDNMQYLHPESHHPKHTFTGLIHGLLLRLQRLNSRRETFEFAAKELFQALLDRGYNRPTLLRHFGNFFRKMTFLGTWSVTKTTKPPPERIPFVMPYNRHTEKCFPELKRAQEEFIASLPTENQRESVRSLLGGPPLPAYRRNRRLRDILVTSKYTRRRTKPKD